jgi:hypothetical protein
MLTPKSYDTYLFILKVGSRFVKVATPAGIILPLINVGQDHMLLVRRKGFLTPNIGETCLILPIDAEPPVGDEEPSGARTGRYPARCPAQAAHSPEE